MLLERGRAENRLAARIDHDRRAVEEELVVAADLVDVDERRAVAAGDAREELLARLPPASGGRRRRNVEEDLGALARQLVDRVLAVEPRAANLVVEPEVLADRDAGAHARDLHD